MCRYARWIAALMLSLTACAALAQATTGWEPVNETIRKSEKDPRQYQAIRLANGLTVLPAHPGSRFSGGNLDKLKDKPDSKLLGALAAFYQTHYSANLMKAVIYSNKPLPEMEQIAASTFGRITDHDAAVPAIDTPVVTDAQQGIIIYYVPAQPRKQLKIEFRIANNSDRFRSKIDTLISYLIGNRSKNTLADWLQKQGLTDGVNAGADPMSERSSGVFAITASLTDKGLAQRDEVVAAIFSYIAMLREQGIDKRYFDEVSHVLALDFRYPSLTRDMDYIEWLADTMLRVPVEHTLDAPYLADDYDAAAIKARLDDMTPQHARIWYISPQEPHNKEAYFVNAPYQVDRISESTFADWQQRASQIQLSMPALNPYIPDDFTLLPDDGKTYTHPVALPGGDRDMPTYWMPSRFYASEPKASIMLALRTMPQSDFAQYQQAMINQLKQGPQTLDEEAARYGRDFDRQNYAFETRQKVIEQIQQLMPGALADFFHQAVMQKEGMAMTSQIAGNSAGKIEFSQLPGWKTWNEVAKLQQSLPVKSETQ